MLANLDQRLQSGEIDQHAYEARRVEILELIRQGKAYSLTPTEKAWRIALGVVITFIGVVLLLMTIAGNGNLVGVIISLAACSFGVNRLAGAMRH